MVEDASKLSTRVQSIADLLREADYWSRTNGHEAVTADDVQRALDATAYRSDQWRERTEEAILRRRSSLIRPVPKWAKSTGFRSSSLVRSPLAALAASRRVCKWAR